MNAIGPDAAPDVSLYTDFQGLSQLQAQAKSDPAKALGKVAQQFEALFLQMMLKSMRDAKLSGGMFNSEQMKTYQEMFDRQIAMNLADQRSLGIADMLVKQLGGKVAAAASTSAPSGAAAATTPGGGNAPREDMAPFIRFHASVTALKDS